MYKYLSLKKVKMNAFIIAGTHSGVGKTTISVALMKAFTESGKKIAPFKIGPDYIDPKFHMIATGEKSYNLDSWLLDEDIITYLFYKHSKGKDLSIIEGVMGLYDGSGYKNRGSSADIAKILKVPVILVVDARGIYTSINALILGYISYDKNVKLEGIILNNVSNKDHYILLKDVIENELDIECVGYFPKDPDIQLESRHLGLIPVEEIINIEEKLNILGNIVKETIDLRKIERISSIHELGLKKLSIKEVGKIGNDLEIAIAKDEAFNFYYEDNLELMKQSGIKLIEFSPLHDEKLPESINGLYIGGGFPEVFADKLTKNSSLLKDINRKAHSGLPIYGECGGLMYLSNGIINKEGNFYEMVKFFNCKTQMTKGLQRFGYIIINFEDIKIRGHEFHHSRLVDIFEQDFTYKYEIKKLNQKIKWKCGLAKKNVLAGYPHIHFYSNFEFFIKIISLFRRSIL